MEPKFYTQLQDYVAQVWAVEIFGLAAPVIGFIELMKGNYNGAELFLIGAIVVVALVYWKTLLKKYD